MQKYNYLRELSDINSEEKAYLLGLLYSDGHVSIDKYYMTSIVLEGKDLYLLEKLKELFPFFYIRKHSESDAYILQSGIKVLAEDLNKRGVLHRKSFENSLNLRFPNIDKSLYHHFIRGFFDGDGSVFIQKINNIKVEMGGVCYNFLTDLLKILYDENINFYMSLRSILEEGRANDGISRQNYYRLYTSSFTTSKLFANYIYKDATIFMVRKKELLCRELIARNQKERLICPTCNKNDTTYLGFRETKSGKKVRIFCKNCNKRTQVIAPDYSNIISGEFQLNSEIEGYRNIAIGEALTDSADGNTELTKALTNFSNVESMDETLN